MKDARVLVIDDDSQVRRLVEQTFSRVGATVLQAENGRIGLRSFYQEKPDLVILDIMMPEADGWDTCRQIRNLSDVPILMLTALDQNEDIIRGLDYGADDFITKPFSPNVLLARARAALRRSRPDSSSTETVLYNDGRLVVDLEQRTVEIDGQPMKLTPKEFDLLGYLLKNRGRLRTIPQILENVWGWAYQGSPEYVHVYVSHLRKKIEADPRHPKYVVTIHGVGYKFERSAV
jgi:two-component system KDP operon response regulator KdpE